MCHYVHPGDQLRTKSSTHRLVRRNGQARLASVSYVRARSTLSVGSVGCSTRRRRSQSFRFPPIRHRSRFARGTDAGPLPRQGPPPWRPPPAPPLLPPSSPRRRMGRRPPCLLGERCRRAHGQSVDRPYRPRARRLGRAPWWGRGRCAHRRCLGVPLPPRMAAPRGGFQVS